MCHSGICPAYVVHIDVVRIGVVQRAARDDNRQIACQQAGDKVIADLTDLNHDPVQQTFARNTRVELLLIGLGLQQKEREGVIVVVARLGNALSQPGEVWIVEQCFCSAWQDQPNHVRLLRSQRLRNGVGAITGFGDDALHAFT